MTIEKIASRAEGFRKFLELTEDGSFYVGHATVLARVQSHLYLIDAVYPKPLFLDSWLFYPELAIDKKLFEVDGVFISHCHEDHYDINFLRDLPSRTPIYITAGRTGFELILEDKSFNVIQVPHFEKFKIAEDVYVVALPSDHNNFDSSFLIKGKTFSIFQGNDNFLGEESLQRAKKISGKVNHAYIPFSYVWWYPFCLTSLSDDKRRAEAKRLTNLNMNIGARIGEVFESDLIIPSAGNLIFFESADSILNREIASPFDFMEYAKTDHPEIAAKCLPLLAGDFAIHTPGGENVYTRNLSKEGFFEEMDVFLKGKHAAEPNLAKRTLLNSDALIPIKKKLEGKNLKSLELDLFFYADDEKETSIKVSMRDYKPSVAPTPASYPGSMLFKIQRRAFEKWVGGEISLETVLNSQRFLVNRNPEEFNKDVWDVLRNNF